MMILDINTGDTAWVLVSAALVLLMTPALAFFYGGMVRSKSVLNMIMMSIVSMGTVSVLWVLFGYSMAFGNSWNGLIGNPTQFAGLANILTASVGAEGHQIPALAFVGFQAAFAVIATALVSGAAADRMTFRAWTLFTILWSILVYFPAAHWVFAFDGFAAEKGGWIANGLKVFDFAGGTAIHINAGAAALAVCLVLGRRVGFNVQPMRPNNLTLVMLGAGLLWIGWFGFNAGSALGATETAALAWVNTLVATAGALLAWLITERIRDGHPTTLGGASGIVAGLVAITPACATVTPVFAIVIGAMAGVVCCLAVRLKNNLGYDDSLDVVGVHMVGGLIGTLAIGLFCAARQTDGINGLFLGGGFEQLGRQALGAVTVMVYSFIVTGAIMLLLKVTMGVRISTKDEIDGIDIHQHAEIGYDVAHLGTRAYRVAHTLVVPAPATPTSPVDIEPETTVGEKA